MLTPEHIGIAVKDLSIAVPLFTKLLNSQCYKTEMVEGEKVNTAFFQQGDTKIELLESTDPDGVIAKFIEKKGEGIHHIAFSVEKIEDQLKHAVELGITLIDSKPRKGADGLDIAFLHPKSTSGVLMELCEKKQLTT